MHNDYYYTDIKGTPFRWKKIFVKIPTMTFSLFLSWLQVSSRLTGCMSPLFASPVLEWRSPEVMGSPSSEEMYQWKLVCLSHCQSSESRGRCPACSRRAYWIVFLPGLALLKRYWLVFFRAPWSGTARCRPGRWMVTLGLWKWAFMHYVGYYCVLIGDVRACDVTFGAPLFAPQDLLQHRGAARAPSPHPNSSHQALHDRPQATPQMYQIHDQYIRLHGACFTCLFVCFFKLTLWL